MAYSVANKCRNKVVRELVGALLDVTPTESYPNGNGGYCQSTIRRHQDALSDLGVTLKCIYGGDAYTVGVYRFESKKHFTNTEIKAIRNYVLTACQARIGKRGWQYDVSNALCCGALTIKPIKNTAGYLGCKVGNYEFFPHRYNKDDPSATQFKDDVFNALESVKS